MSMYLGAGSLFIYVGKILIQIGQTYHLTRFKNMLKFSLFNYLNICGSVLLGNVEFPDIQIEKKIYVLYCIFVSKTFYWKIL